jgi:hypothetical protein
MSAPKLEGSYSWLAADRAYWQGQCDLIDNLRREFPAMSTDGGYPKVVAYIRELQTPKPSPKRRWWQIFR